MEEEWIARNPERHRHNLAELMALYEAGKVRPYVSERFPLAQGAMALRDRAVVSAERLGPAPAR